MQRLLPTLCAIVLLATLGTAAARAQEGPGMTAVRQLDLAAQHLAISADREVREGRVTPAQAQRLADLAAVARGFHFEFESSQYGFVQAEEAWAELSDTFLAARRALGDAGSKSLRNEVLRVHALMNRIDLGLG